MGNELNEYQRHVVEQTGRRIKDSGMLKTLTSFSSSPDDSELRSKANQQHIVDISVPVGSGKTRVIGSLIKDHLPEYVVLMLATGSGALQERTVSELNEITGSAHIMSADVLKDAPAPGTVYVFKGGPEVIKRKDSEDNAFYDWLNRISSTKTPVAVIIDDSSPNTKTSFDPIMPILNDIRTSLGYSPFVIISS